MTELPRDIRDSWRFRAAAIAAVLIVALLVGRGCVSSGREITQAEAEKIARASTTFVPDRMQIRLIQQGIPPRAIWAVSLYRVDAKDEPTVYKVVRVDASTGEVITP